MRALRVYLDSSDFSVLSDPGRAESEAPGVLVRLRELVASNQTTCHFSGTHLSEMAPVDALYVDAAERRGALVAELCGRNALISQDRLFAEELRNAHELTETRPQVYSSNGDWFPQGIANVSPVGASRLAKGIAEVIGDLGLNRKARRLAERKALKRGKPRADLHAAVVTNARSGSIDEILEKYPMRPQDARVLARYAVGDANADEAQKAFLESLRDPRWMMAWFRSNHAKLTPFIEWTRKPAASMIASLDEMAKHAALLRAGDAFLGTSVADDLLSSSRWKSWQDELLVRIASRMSEILVAQKLPLLQAITIDKACPGLSVGVRSLHSALWALTATKPRRPKLSDFPDALHAIYAPYVDIFRADSFMAPHIRSQVRRFGTLVVPKLTELLPAIDAALRGSAGKA